jgi:hypothetical protein
MISGRPQTEVLHSILDPIRMRNIDSRYPTAGGRRAQGTQNRTQSVVIEARIPSKSQTVKPRLRTNPPGRESPQYCPTSQWKTAHA